MNITSKVDGRARLATLAMAGLLAFAGVPAWAQKAYRCGTVYQDRPCAAVQDGKAVNTTGAGQPVLPDERVDADCARRGQAAQRLAWTRESGKTEQEQLANARGAERELVGEVYRRRGSSLEVRKGVEADCMSAKERATLPGAAVPAAAVPAAAMPVPVAEPPRLAASATVAAKVELKASSKAEDEAQARKRKCDSVRAQLDAVRLEQKTGGDAQRQDLLNRKRGELDKQLLDSRC